MPSVTTKDGVDIFYKDWATVSRSSSAMAAPVGGRLGCPDAVFRRQTPANPGGLPKAVFDEFQAQLAADRSGFYRSVAAGPFYGYNRPGVTPSEAMSRTGGDRA